MFLSDCTIKQLIWESKLVIDPYDVKLIQPCSYDLTLADLDKPRPLMFDHLIWGIEPDEFVLGVTREFIKLPSNIAGTVLGKSTWGRKGLSIHQTAGHVDPGWKGELTLELYNCSKEVIVIRQFAPIAQIVFTSLDVDCEHPYAGRYQGSQGIVQPRASLEFQMATKDSEYIVHKSMCDYPERACLCK